MATPSPRDVSVQHTSSPRSSELVFLLLAGTALLACSTVVSVPQLPPPSPDHPLPECPVPTNCVRTSQTYPVPASTLFDAAQQALRTLGPATLRSSPDSLQASAVYRVSLVFKDDVTVAVTPRNGTSTLHVRSTSRIGRYDFEVNRRRVQDLLDAVNQALPTAPPRE